VDTSACQLESISTLTVAPLAPFIAVESGPVLAAGTLGGGLAYAQEGNRQFQTASPDGGALISKTAQGFVLSATGAKIGIGAFQQTESILGGSALAAIGNTIVLPQLRGAMAAIDAYANGGGAQVRLMETPWSVKHLALI